MEEHKAQDAEAIKLEEETPEQGGASSGEPETAESTEDANPPDNTSEMEVDDDSFPPGSLKFEHSGTEGNSEPSPTGDDENVRVEYYTDNSNSDNQMILHIDEEEIRRVVCAERNQASDVDLEVREEIIILDTVPDDATDPTENDADALNLSKDLDPTEEIGEDSVRLVAKSVDEDESKCSQEESSEITLVMPTVEAESEHEALERKESEDDKINVEIQTIVISNEEIDPELKSDDSHAVVTVVSASVDEYVPGQLKILKEASRGSKSNEGANGSTEKLRTADDVTNEISDEATTATPLKEGSVKSAESRSMVQEIVDEWVEENNEEIDSKTNVGESHDLVEIELKTLLAEDKPVETGTAKEKPEAHDLAGQAKVENDVAAKERLNGSEKVVTVAKDRKTNATGDEGSAKKKMDPNLPVPDYIPPHLLGRTLNNPESDAMGSKYKPQTPRPGVKVPGRHLTSQIASTAEVTKVLKERIKQKHKEFDSPQGGDILFVKKITQRLSSKLSSIPTHLPELIPLSKPVQSSSENHSDAQTANETLDSAKIVETVDNRELLAILEGDVDPDWSNLKPHSLVESSKSVEPEVESAAPQKLDPVVERELALKQLLELPSIPLKKNSAKKKRTFKPAASKLSVTNSPVLNAMIRDGGKGGRSADIAHAEETKPTPSSEDDEEIDDSNVRIKVEIGDGENAERRVLLQTEESRSGRKRKPTERAREHEQNTSNKKQKVYKGKVASEKRTYQTKVARGVARSSLPEPRKIEVDDAEEEEDQEEEEEEEGEGQEEEEEEKKEEEAENKKKEKKEKEKEDKKKEKDEARSGEHAQPAEPAKCRVPSRSKAPSLGKKASAHVGKRNNNNMSVKKLIRQKSSSSSSNAGDGRKAVGLKSRYVSSPKKIRGSMKRKAPKRLINISSGDINLGSVRPKKKTNEIDKLLQDEGVVNLLYDVEQPDQKRLVPITKSQTKVMDLHKVKRELRMRTKMVRNAVLRLNTSTSVTPTKMSPRSKRAVSQATDVQQTREYRSDNQQQQQESAARSARASAMSSPTDFILPAKIRNAADASVIIRRHSASSYSSTSGSPRVSIDGPEKLTDDGPPVHVTRSTRRRHSQNRQSVEASSSKKHNPSKKKSVETGGDSEEEASFDAEGGVVVFVVNRSTSRVEGNNKSTEKTSKSSPPNDKGRPSGVASGSKITTRSNGTLPNKGGVAKSKKGTRTKIVSNKTTNNEADDSAHEEAGGEEDELSACLAEAVSALSGVDGGGVDRSGGGGGGNSHQLDRKSKAYAAEPVDNSWTDLLSELATSGEMNFRRCGNLVQIILTPSSTVLNNGITLELMHELREALALLRKDDGCRVVLVTSTGSSFCEGLDLSSLLLENKEDRRARAEEMALGLKEFIKSLANFNKPIVAGVQGPAIGLGVTILPLFDLIIASDKATFGTPYGQLGQIPEGAAIFTLSQTIGNTVISELLLGGKTITASEALRAGLVTRVLWPDRFQAELLPSLQAMSEQSSQSMEATKTLLRHNLRKKLDAALESESYVLIQHWCSAECQSLIKGYLEGKDRQGSA